MGQFGHCQIRRNEKKKTKRDLRDLSEDRGESKRQKMKANGFEKRRLEWTQRQKDKKVREVVGQVGR